MYVRCYFVFFCFKQKTAYEILISDWSSDVCSSDLLYYDDMRIAGAQARKFLLQAAARKWGVDASELTTEPSVVVHKASGRRMTYGEVAAFADVPAQMPAVSKDELKKPEAFRLIGKPVDRRDIPAKVNGSAMFAMDVNVPGMVYATTVPAPVPPPPPATQPEKRR